MNLGRLRKNGRLPRLGAPALFLGILWWFSLSCNYDLFKIGGDYDYPEIRLRYFERDLLLLESGKDGNQFIQWWTGASDELDTLEELQKVLPKYSLESGGTPNLAKQLIEQKIAVARGLEAQKIHWPENVARDLDSIMLQHESFVLEAFGQIDPDPLIEQHLKEVRQKVLKRSLVSSALEIFWMIGAIFLAWWIYSRAKPEGRDWKIFKTWSPTVLLSVFFVSQLIAEWAYDAGYQVFYIIGIDGYAPWIWLDFVWRALPAIVMGLFFFGLPRSMIRSFGLKQAPQWRLGFWMLGVLFCIDRLMWEIGLFGEVDPNDYFNTTDPNLMNHVSEFLSAVIAAPIFEELVFRGFLFLGLRSRLGNWWAAGISSVLFAVIHVQYDLWGMISVGIFGLGCCWLVWRTRSLMTGIVVHAILNGYLTWHAYVNYQQALW